MSAAGRLFFALWPSPGHQAVLAERGARMQSLLGGRLTRAESVHLTLVFVGDVADAAVGEVLSAGAAQYGQPFELILDIVGCWKHNGIAWAAPARVPPPLLALVEGLESRLRAAGFELENRRYRPHVTLLRRAECRPVDAQPGEPLRWMVDRFVLVRSRRSGRGSDYERLAEWQLKPDISRRD